MKMYLHLIREERIMNLKKKIEAYLNESPVYVAGPEKFFRDVEISDTEKKRIKNEMVRMFCFYEF